MTSPAALVNRVWNYAHVLRDDGVSYGDYVEQITCLLFLKMDAERVADGETSAVPAEWRWERLRGLDGDALEVRYRHTLEALARAPGLLGTIYRKAQNKIQDPAKLRRLMALIDEETWTGLDLDVKGSIYEGLLQRNAQEVKSGAGQYFTPRPLIQAIVEVMDPRPGTTLHDPACGTGGFMLAAFDHLKRHAGHDRQAIRKLREETLSGVDIVDGVVRLCAMNLYLHGIGGTESPVVQDDALISAGWRRYGMVLTNPPFGKKSSVTVIGEDGEVGREGQTYDRQDFTATTSNKQLNFLQHVMSILEQSGRAAVVLPDNVLFEGGAGEKVRRKLLQSCDFHTLMRLPTGIFYSQGVKANVLFFDRKPASETPWTKRLWVYDFRTNQRFTLKERPLARSHLDDFVACFRSGRRHERVVSERFKSFPYDELIARDKVNLDLIWLKDYSLEDASNLPPPAILAAEIVESLEAALDQFRQVAAALPKPPAIE